MKTRYLVLLTLIVVSFSGLLDAAMLNKGTDSLNEALLETKSDQELISVFLVMSEQVDTQQLYSRMKDLPKAERRKQTVSTLKQFSKATQNDISAFLNNLEKGGDISDVRYLWISNIIALKAPLNVLKQIDQRNDVARIEYDPLRYVILDESSQHSVVSSDESSSPRNERNMVYNIPKMNVDAVWDRGFYGDGALVAVIDSGVNYNHYDIRNRLWISDEYPYYGYNFTNNTYDTMDDRGHGSHCIGTVAGDGTSGIKTGIAPRATIMALKVLTAQGQSQQTWFMQATEFAVEQGADILSMSMGWYHSQDPDRRTMRDVMANTLSAGVIASVSAGNAGHIQSQHPIPSNTATPADCPPPWLSPDQTIIGGLSAVFTLGATEPDDEIADFSSRGPVTWQNVLGYNDYPYQPGIGLIKPDITAPGVDVTSLRHNSNTGYVDMTGTSMSAPATAGVMALLVGRDPDLVPEQIAQILEETAVRLTESKSNDYGAGRVDAYAAFNRLEVEYEPGAPFNDYPANEAINIPLNASLKWLNNKGATSYTLYFGTDNPPTNIINGHQTEEREFIFEEELVGDTVYYWRVDAHNDLGNAEGDLWSFTTVLPVSENFATGNFSGYDWELSTTGQGTEEWFITSDLAVDGTYSARSGSIGHSSSTTMSVRLEIVEDGQITFYRKVSSEQSYDFLRFYIDNTLIQQWSGEQDWEEVVFPVNAGYRRFRWVYIKDPMNSSGLDAGWIDKITFPRHPKPPVIYVPRDISSVTDYEKIDLSWDIDINEEVNPIEFTLLGFNLYRSDDESEFYQKINNEIMEEQNYSEYFTAASEINYYLTAVYRIMGQVTESDSSDTVTVTIFPALDEPLIEPSGGEFTDPVLISISTEEGEEVYYTTDGSEPNLNSELYSDAFLVAESTIVKARAYSNGYLPGVVATAEYIIETTSADQELLPKVLTLSVYPNPVTGRSTTRGDRQLSIEFYLPDEQSTVEIGIYNLRGQRVKVFSMPNLNQGKHLINWDLKTNQGSVASNGVYFVRFLTEETTLNRRIMLLK